MTDRENKNISTFLADALRYLRNKGKKNGLDLSSDNFEKNLSEIVNNPNSEYAEDVYLFDEIPELKEEEKTLNEKIKTLKSEAEKLNLEINGNEGAKGLNAIAEELKNKKDDLEKKLEGDDKSQDENEKKGLEKIVRELEVLRDDIEMQIDGDEESENDDLRKGLREVIKGLLSKKDNLEKQIDGDKDAKDIFLRIGLAKRKENLEKSINGDPKEKNEAKRNGLLGERNKLNRQIDDLTKRNSIVEKLADLKKESIDNKSWYYGYVFFMMIIIFLSLCFAYCYGHSVIEDVKAMGNRESKDYFGMFLLKMPFSLMIITFVSGGFIFINRLLVIIERINNQLRNISQISVIASQIDQRAIDLISDDEGYEDEHDEAREEIKKENLQEAKSNKKHKTLFYKLIADYLFNLSKNELESRERKGSQMKFLKEFAEIIHKIKPLTKND